MNNKFRTVEERQILLNIVRNYEEISDKNPELTESRILNLLHNRGINCSRDKLAEALELARNSTSSQQGVSTKRLAEMTGIPLGTLKGYLWGEKAPDDFPRPHQIGKSDTGKAIYFDFMDAERVRLWNEVRKTEAAKSMDGSTKAAPSKAEPKP